MCQSGLSNSTGFIDAFLAWPADLANQYRVRVPAEQPNYPLLR